MTGSSRWTIGLAAVVAFASIGFALDTVQGGDGASRGVKCPDGFVAVFDSAAKVLRCRRDVVRWVVTACSDKSFGTYVVRPGADTCGPTEIPGVGIPPGAKGSRPIECAAHGYRLLTDRTGQRDRCERTETQFVLPLPAN